MKLGLNKGFITKFSNNYRPYVDVMTWGKIEGLIGRLGKPIKETEQDPLEVIRAARASGASWSQLSVYGVSEDTLRRIIEHKPVTQEVMDKIRRRMAELDRLDASIPMGPIARSGAPINGAVKMGNNSRIDFACVRPAVQAKVAKLQLLAELGSNKYNKDEEHYILEALSKM